MTFVYIYTIYKRIISEQHKWDTFATLTILCRVPITGLVTWTLVVVFVVALVAVVMHYGNAL